VLHTLTSKLNKIVLKRSAKCAAPSPSERKKNKGVCYRLNSDLKRKEFLKKARINLLLKIYGAITEPGYVKLENRVSPVSYQKFVSFEDHFANKISIHKKAQFALRCYVVR
jgi:hypothetical protein